MSGADVEIKKSLELLSPQAKGKLLEYAIELLRSAAADKRSPPACPCPPRSAS